MSIPDTANLVMQLYELLRQHLGANFYDEFQAMAWAVTDKGDVHFHADDLVFYEDNGTLIATRQRAGRADFAAINGNDVTAGTVPLGDPANN